MVEVLDLIEDDQQAWLVEDWVDGTSVSALLDAGGAFSPVEAVAIISDALAGLAHVHQRAIVHGNLAAGSLLLTATGTIKLTAFGAPSPPTGGWPITPQSDVRAAGAILRSLLPVAPPQIEAVLTSAAAPDRCYRNGLEFRQALTEAAAFEFGADWREQVDLSRCLRRASVDSPESPPAAVLEPAVAASPLSAAGSALEDGGVGLGPDAVSGVPMPPSVHRVKVRSPKRTSRPEPPVAAIREYLELRPARAPGGDGNAGKFIPIIATLVVVVAIVVLVLTHHDMGKATPTGLALHGRYDVTTTLKSAGVGADQDQAIGSSRPDVWQVTSACPQSTTCTASITPSSGAVFTLTLTGDTWTGEQSMPADKSCVGVYSYTLKVTSSAGDGLVGTVVGTAAGCGRSGTESRSLAASRGSG